VAHIDNAPLYLSQVEWQFRKSLGPRQLADELAADLHGQILDQLVNQQLVLLQLADTELDASEDEVNLEIANIAERAGQNGMTLEEWLAGNHQSLLCLRFNVRWQIAWKRYTERTLTDAVLEQYFERHRREFDGTRVKVAHLLLPIPSGATDKDRKLRLQTAATVREAIAGGQLNWSDAVKQYSSAPTASQGGEIGWIEVDRPMPPAFSRAAFLLEPGEISPPVETIAGVHLIKCLAVEPGTTNWYDVKQAVRSAAVQELFRLMAGRQHKKTDIRISEDLPWRKPKALPPADRSGGE
jgi:parvulin-like peptidyl-prolyl isomerase